MTAPKPDTRRLSRRLATAGATLAAATLMLTGCAASVQDDTESSTTASSEATADELRVAITAYPSSWDQDFVAYDPVALAMYKNVYPYLVDYGITDVDGGQIFDTENIYPTWAESFTSDNGTDWTLVIKDGATFPSGNPITAEDVKWSKDRAFAAQANVAGVYSLIGLTEPDQVEVIDDSTVVFHQSFASALTEQIQAISLFIYDSEVMMEHATDDDPWATEWAAQNPSDGGYYTVSSTVANQEIVLTANPDYLGDNPSNIDTIRFTVVSDTASAAVLLQEGDVDIALGLSTSEIADLADAEGVSIISAPSNQMVYLPINTEAESLSDPLVRQAIAYAIPYEQIISTVYGGEARRPMSIVPIDMPGYTEDGFPYDTDIDAAQALLDEAGVTDLTIELGYPAEDGASEQIAILVQASLAEIGITVEPLPLDSATLGERRAAKDLDMQIASGQQWVNDVEYLMAGWTTGAYTNYANYSSEVVDGIVASAAGNTDTEARNALWADLQVEFAEDVPVIPLAQPNFQLPVADSVSGFVQPVDGLIRFNTFTLN